MRLNSDKNANQSIADQSELPNLNSHITEIYKYTDKGPFNVNIEKKDIDSIEIGFKLMEFKYN